MARCEGTTKSGARCRRPAGTDSAFCSSHAPRQESDAKAAANRTSATGSASGSKSRPSRERHPLAAAAAIGVAAIVLMALRRVVRF